MRRSLPLLVPALVLLLTACAADDAAPPADVGADLAAPDAPTGADAAPDAPAAAVCGDDVCAAGEDCLDCPDDCVCACGDGVCTAGEFCAVCPADCDCETLAATPPMGWNSWNRFGCDVDAALIRETADALAASGLREAGYRYVNVDDCWQVERAADGTIVADPQRFPDGMAALAEHVHGLGLRFGVYTDIGPLTCQERPGSLGFEAQDARTYAAWGVDFVKVDWCFTAGYDAPSSYARFAAGLAEAGRPIVFSICNWGEQSPWIWGPRTGQLWRTTGDIFDHWVSVLANAIQTAPYAAAARPGAWNDPDMLEVGNGGLTPAEARAHLSLWAVLAAPLIAGNDLRVMDDETRAILTNAEVIAVDQDPDGVQGVPLATAGAVTGGVPAVWARPLRQHGARAVLLLNDGVVARDVSVRWADLGLAPGPVAVRDLWEHADRGAFPEGYTAHVPPHAAVLVKVVGREPLPPAGPSWLSDLPWRHVASPLGPPERDRANGGVAAGDGDPLSIAGATWEKGVGLHAGSLLVVHLGGRCRTFAATAGVDDAATPGATATFEVWADGQRLFASAPHERGAAGLPVAVDLAGRRELHLRVEGTGTSLAGTLVDWAEARLVCD
jgi:alpha-galactosidase